MANKTIRLFWWNEKKVMGKPKENYGDVLGKYIVEKISSKRVVFTDPRKLNINNFWSPIYVTIGSILTYVNEKCVVWGSGIISLDIPVKKAKYLAVRGPQTRQYLTSFGYDVPEVYGDPAILLPQFYHPNITKAFKFGVVPHYNDYNVVRQFYKTNDEVKVINLMTDDVEMTTREILECEYIISSSLHGIIVAHAYNIPAIWVRFSDKLFGDNIKFIDYFESVEIKPYQSDIFSEELEVAGMKRLLNLYPSLPEKDILLRIKKGLLDTCPFYN